MVINSSCSTEDSNGVVFLSCSQICNILFFFLSEYLMRQIIDGRMDQSIRIIVVRGYDFEQSTNPSKSYPNKRYVNWSRHTKYFMTVISMIPEH